MGVQCPPSGVDILWKNVRFAPLSALKIAQRALRYGKCSDADAHIAIARLYDCLGARRDGCTRGKDIIDYQNVASAQAVGPHHLKYPLDIIPTLVA